MSLPTREASTSASRASNAQVAIRRLQRRLHPLGGKSCCRLPPGAVLLLGHKSSHLRIDQLTAASGVTGPCVLAVSRGCFIAAPIATSGAVTGVGDRINTHVPSSRRQPRWPAIGWTPLVLWNTQKRLERSCSQTAGMDAHAFRRRRRRRRRPPPSSRTDRSRWTARAILRPVVV